MKTFTVRELDRKPGLVLDTCDREGGARIRRRDGRSYRIEPEAVPEGMQLPPDFSQHHLDRIAQIFPKPISAEQANLVDRLIAGE